MRRGTGLSGRRVGGELHGDAGRLKAGQLGRDLVLPDVLVGKRVPAVIVAGGMAALIRGYGADGDRRAGQHGPGAVPDDPGERGAAVLRGGERRGGDEEDEREQEVAAEHVGHGNPPDVQSPMASRQKNGLTFIAAQCWPEPRPPSSRAMTHLCRPPHKCHSDARSSRRGRERQ